MKTLLTVLVLVCSQISFASSQEALMSSFDLNPTQFADPIDQAKVTVDEANQMVEIALRFENSELQLPSDHVIALPLIDKYQGDCGTTVYVAQKPSRVIGAPVETIIVTDYSTIVCRMLIPADQMTKVQLGEVIKGESEELMNESVFAGVVLQ